MSDIYSAGNQTTAIALIKAKALSLWTNDPDGGKRFDTEAMVNWINDQLIEMIGDSETENPQAALQNGIAREQVGPLLAAIRKEHWVNRSDFPNAAVILSGDALLTAARDGQAELRRLSEDLTNHYQALKKAAPQQIDWYSSEINIQTKVPAGVNREVDSRVYVFTYVTNWEEESAPSAPSVLVEGDQNDTVTITVPAPPPDRAVTKWRLYRSASGSVGAAFQFVKEVALPALTTIDNVKGELLGEVLPTQGWAEPPTNMGGVVSMPNGIMAGFFDNTVCFCDPYHPYAWPIEYQITVDTPIVGLGVFGQTLFVGTRGAPYLISGADSASMSAVRLDSNQACVNARTIVGLGSGVMYASPDGLCYVDNSLNVQLVTEGHISREEWHEFDLVDINALFAAAHEETYFLFHPVGSYMFDLKAAKLSYLNVQAKAAWTDQISDTLYVVIDDYIAGLFENKASRRRGRWLSKLQTLGAPQGFAWMAVQSDFTAPVTVRWYADGALRFEKTVTNNKPVRLPPGRWLEHAIEVESSTTVVSGVSFAGSTTELKAVE